ncbi:MAG: 50S ribosomal protein L10 [Neomegalonema sp.]|nr:50S ribosomal protein L10 [Neomegalonema sp.]
MDRAQKAQAVEDLGRIVEDSGVIIVAHYATMSVPELEALRGKMREQQATFKVAKNRLMKIALEGKPEAAAADLFKGQTGIAFSKDPVAAAKVTTAYAKENDKFVILGGALGGQFLTPDAVKALADMPSIEELRARLLGAFKAPLAKMAGVAKAPPQKMAGVAKAVPGKLLGVLKAYEAKLNEG